MTITKGFEPNEVQRVAEIYWDAFGAKLGRVLGPDLKAQRFVERVADPNHVLAYRDLDGVILGIAGFKTAAGAFVGGAFRDLVAIYGWWGAGWRAVLLSFLERDTENERFLMDGICVTEAARGRGVGTALLEAIAREAADRGYTEVRLDVIDSNPRARALYERRGFHASGQTSLGGLRHIYGFQSATTMVRRIA